MSSIGTHTHLSDDKEQMPFFVDKSELERTFLPINNDCSDLNPDDFKTDDHFWNTFGKVETESTMRWLMVECQKNGSFSAGVTAKGISYQLCLDGLVLDLGDNKFSPTRLALRKLAGTGYYKPL